MVLGSDNYCLGRFRGAKGVVLGSYIHCLGRFRGPKGMFLRGPGGPLLRVFKLGRVLVFFWGFGRFWTVLIKKGLFGGPTFIV